MNEVVGNPVDVPRNADRINKTENQHDPERNAREKVKHTEEVDAVQNACGDRDGVPGCVREDPGIRLRTIDRNEIGRGGWHSFRSQHVGIHNIDKESSRKFYWVSI